MTASRTAGRALRYAKGSARGLLLHHHRGHSPIWRRWSGYQRRSRAETRMHCVKLLGQLLSARDFDRQVAEFQIRVTVLNGFTALGIPVTEAVG